MSVSSINAMFDSARQDYRAGKETRFTQRLTGTMPGGSGADYHIRSESEYFRAVERARHFERNDPLIGQGLRRLTANIIQDGFSCDFHTGDSKLDEELKDRISEWSDDADLCDSEGERTFAQMEQIGFLSVLRDGDILALPRADGRLQWCENHRLRTPSSATKNIVHGVECDPQTARRIRYWLTHEDIGLNGIGVGTKFTAMPARDADDHRNVLHLYLPTRFSQRRGVTVTAPVTDMIGMHDDLQFTTLVKAQMASLIGILRTRSADWEPSGDSQYGERRTESGDGYIRLIEELQAGLEVASDKGETITAFSANIPNNEFFAHSSLILTFIAVNLDLPLCVLLLDPTKTNFSGWRGAIDQARMRFRQLQQWLISSLHKPVTRWKLREWAKAEPALARAIERAGRTCFTWHPPGFPYVDPQADIACDVLQHRTATNSMRRIQSARGRDWDDVSDEIVEDNAKAIRKAAVKAAELNQEFPDLKINWREVLNLPTPEGVNISLPGSDQKPQQNEGVANNPAA